MRVRCFYRELGKSAEEFHTPGFAEDIQRVRSGFCWKNSPRSVKKRAASIAGSIMMSWRAGLSGRLTKACASPPGTLRGAFTVSMTVSAPPEVSGDRVTVSSRPSAGTFNGGRLRWRYAQIEKAQESPKRLSHSPRI